MSLQGAEEPTLPFDDLIVRAAYEPAVNAMLQRTPLLDRFAPTPEERRRREERAQAEDRRRVSLMRDHQSTSGTTSVCRCGHVGYSTSGYLLHLYDVIATDAAGGKDQ